MLKGMRVYPKKLLPGHTLPDVIFSSSLSHIPWCRLLAARCQSVYPVLFLIESGPVRHAYSPSELCSQSYVRRNDSISVIIERFKHVWFDRRKRLKQNSTVCQTCHKNRLTSREIEILRLLYKQVTISQMAQIMGVSPKTVFCFKINAMHKLGLKNRRHLYDWLNNEMSREIFKIDSLR